MSRRCKWDLSSGCKWDLSCSAHILSLPCIAITEKCSAIGCIARMMAIRGGEMQTEGGITCCFYVAATSIQVDLLFLCSQLKIRCKKFQVWTDGLHIKKDVAKAMNLDGIRQRKNLLFQTAICSLSKHLSLSFQCIHNVALCARKWMAMLMGYES